MFNFIKRLLAPPIFPDDENRTHQAYLLNIILWGLIAVALASLFLAPQEAAFGLFANILLLILLKLRYVRTASIIQVMVFWLLFAYLSYSGSGASGPAYLLGFGIVIIIAGVLLGGWGAVALTTLVLITGGYIVYAESNGLKTFVPAGNSAEVFPYSLILFPMSALLQNLAARTIQQALRRARASEKELAEKNQDLQTFSANLENIVTERTAELAAQRNELAQRSVQLEEAGRHTSRRATQFQAISEVSRATASIQNLGELLPRVAEVINKQFGFYHVGIFLLDEVKEFAVLAAANSAGGKKMLARNHRLKVGQVGIVGYVTGEGKPRIALDTGKDAVFFNNPDLPETHSEMALPLISGNQIIGALDVQSTEPNAFSQEDVDVLSTLADQVSIAIQNARLFDETQKALAEAEAIYRQSLRQAWTRAGTASQGASGFQYNLLGSKPLDEFIENKAITEATASGKMNIQRDAEGSTVAVPIVLRGEIIGVLNVRTPGDQAFDQNNLDIVQAVADRVAISAENARLFEETTSRAERERTVADITNKIRSTNDPQEMIQTALEELKRALNVTRVQIVPYAAQAPNEQK